MPPARAKDMEVMLADSLRKRGFCGVSAAIDASSCAFRAMAQIASSARIPISGRMTLSHACSRLSARRRRSILIEATVTICPASARAALPSIHVQDRWPACA